MSITTFIKSLRKIIQEKRELSREKKELKIMKAIVRSHYSVEEILLTRSVKALTYKDQFDLFRKILNYDLATNTENGYDTVIHNGVKYLWSIDCYEIMVMCIMREDEARCNL